MPGYPIEGKSFVYEVDQVSVKNSNPLLPACQEFSRRVYLLFICRNTK